VRIGLQAFASLAFIVASGQADGEDRPGDDGKHASD